MDHRDSDVRLHESRREVLAEVLALLQPPLVEEDVHGLAGSVHLM